MFDETNFPALLPDGFGRARKFYVHIPASYDIVTVDEKMPVIFAFHGGGQERADMIKGKWEDHFDQEVAFVIPLREADPCDPTRERAWMGVGIGTAENPQPAVLPANCDPATQRQQPSGTYITYWDATMPGSFTDVLFIEELRPTILNSFPNLNENKVYATGFSSGGGMTNSLLFIALICFAASAS